MTSWEYEIKYIRYGDWEETKADLNQMGLDGWELVKFNDDINDHMRIAFFKRSLDGLEI